MGYGSLGLYGRKRWAGWVCAGTLAVMTLWLPFGYLRLASLPGREPDRVLVTFSLLALLNLIVIGYLVSPGYRRLVRVAQENAPPASADNPGKAQR